MSDIEQQFMGNCVRLVNQVRDLQGDIAIKNKMIELMANDLYNSYYDDSVINVIKKYESESQKQLVTEQNKKAAEGSNVI